MAILVRYLITLGTLFSLLVTLVVYEADLSIDSSRGLRTVAIYARGLSAFPAPRANSESNEKHEDQPWDGGAWLKQSTELKDVDVTHLGVENLTTRASQNQFLRCAGAKLLHNNLVNLQNLSSSLYPCKKMSFQSNGPIVALGSYPGSGNSWVRQLLEAATGIYTGAIYCDHSYVRAGMIGEGIQTENVIAIKTHRQPPSVLPKTKPDKAIYIIRNPFECIAVEWAWNWHKGKSKLNKHIAETTMETYDDGEWDTAVKKSAKEWLQHVKTWLTAKGTPTLVVEYDDLKIDTYGELKRMLDFIGYTYTEDNILCATKPTSSNSFRRNHTKQFDPYTPAMRQFVNAIILQLNTELEINSISLRNLNSVY